MTNDQTKPKLLPSCIFSPEDRDAAAAAIRANGGVGTRWRRCWSGLHYADTANGLAFLVRDLEGAWRLWYHAFYGPLRQDEARQWRTLRDAIDGVANDWNLRPGWANEEG